MWECDSYDLGESPTFTPIPFSALLKMQSCLGLCPLDFLSFLGLKDTLSSSSPSSSLPFQAPSFAAISAWVCTLPASLLTTRASSRSSSYVDCYIHDSWAWKLCSQMPGFKAWLSHHLVCCLGNSVTSSYISFLTCKRMIENRTYLIGELQGLQ